MQSTVAARILARKNFLLCASQMFRQRNVLFHFSLCIDPGVFAFQKRQR